LATHAAARLLADNHSVLQSWPLALTAYNHGLAGMRRAAEQQRTTDIDVIVAKYQSRSFGFASRNFYTAFLAAIEIDANHEKYFGKIALDPPSPTEVVHVPAYVTVETLAKALNLRQSVLRELNPALTDAVWAGDKYVPKGFPLRLPMATAALAANLMSGIGAAERYAAQRPDLQHRVRRGDTLSQIAAEYGVSLAALMRVNGLSSRDVIRVGQMVSLPQTAGTAATAVAALASAAPPAEPAAQVVSGLPGTYVVRRGDSVARIASRLGVAIEELLAANSIGDRNLIYPGQTLRLPGAASEAQPTEAATVAAPEVVAAALPEPAANLEPAAPPSADEPAVEDGIVATLEADALPEDSVTGLEAVTEVNALAAEQAALAADPSDYSVSGDTIVVQALETLGHYADWLGLPTQRLRDLNGLSFREAVVIGQRLKIDLRNVDTASFEQRRVAYQQAQQGAFFARYHIEGIENHVIKSGESLWLLAGRTYKVPVWLLRQYNPDLDLDRVPAGTVVKFPKLRAVPPSATEPAPTVAASGV
jgi:membrane-bound lytic murein transglycosylase D